MVAPHNPIADTEVDVGSPLTTGLRTQLRDNAAFGKTAWAYKTVGETVNNSTVLQDDDHLFFTIADAEVWQYSFTIEANLWAASDLKIQLTHPGGSGYYSTRLYRISAAATPISAVQAAATGSPLAILVPADDTYMLHIDGSYTATAAGTFKLQWAQNTAVAHATTFVVERSFMLAHRIDGW